MSTEPRSSLSNTFWHGVSVKRNQSYCSSDSSNDDVSSKRAKQRSVHRKKRPRAF